MKKKLYTFFAIITCVVFMTGCGFFSKPDDTSKDDNELIFDIGKDTEDPGTTEDDGEEIPVGNPEDATSEEETTEAGDTGNDTPSDKDESSDPRENIANDAAKEYTGTGKYCGFIDSNSVEIELSNGSYCSFFVFKDDVRNTLSALDEEDMPEITFTYKAKDGQINPEMISVIGG